MTASSRKGPIEAPERRLRVLVVEDCADSAAMVTRLLESAGHQVATTRNGTEALVVAESFAPEAVLIDIGLPGLDGLHVARELRKKKGRVILIAITGRSGPEDLRDTRTAGFDHHMVKPLDFPRLVELLAASEEVLDV